MSGILAYPFRFAGGHAVTVEEKSDGGIAQSLALVLLTRLGERPLVPSFGLADPAFSGVDVAAVNAVLLLHGPPVTVTGLAVAATSERTEALTITYQPGSGQ